MVSATLARTERAQVCVDSIDFMDHNPELEGSSIPLGAQPGHTHGPEAMVMAESSESTQQLRPTDRGSAAWRFLFATFIIEAFIWGFPLSFGVFQDYYTSHPPFTGNPHVPVIGTIATGLFYLGAPFLVPLIRRWPRWRCQMIWLGWTVLIGSLVAASFCNTVVGLIMTQGVLYSTGTTVLYWPIISMLNEWFVSKRGLALGLICASTGVSGAVMPFVLAVVLDKYGYKVTLRAVAIFLVISTGPMLPMLKGRLPPSHSTVTARGARSFLTMPLFYFYAVSVLLQGLGYFYPTLYLPSYATALGYSPAIGALLLALFSVMQTFGQITCGYLSDRHVSVEMLAFVFPLISSISIFTLWGLARSLAPLIVFSLLYGFWGGGYVVVWSKMGLTLSEDPTVGLYTFGIFAFLKGVGNVITGPISGGLIQPQVVTFEYAVGRYKWVVSYSGICMFVCSVTMVSLFIYRKVARQSTG